MKLIITGGAGFIGSNFILYIMDKYPDYEVLCLDKLTYAADISVLEPLMSNNKFSFKKADIRDRKTVYEIFDSFKPDIVINFAAESHVDRSIENPDIFLQTNFSGVGVLLDACVKYGKVRFHQISTDEVYGDLPYDDIRKFSENSNLCPSSPYSASKAAADLLVLSYQRTYGVPVTISRSANNYGRYQHREKLIPLMIEKALTGDELPLYGDGRNIREWINVYDHCSAIDLVIHKGKIGEIYNIGGVEISNIELVKRLCTLLKVPYSRITYVADRPGHDRRYASDYTKIKNLGWCAKISLDEGLRETIKWYKDVKK